MELQVFGTPRSADTRKALRFFAERRIRTHFVDLNVRAASMGELRRFAERFGVHRILDRGSRRFRDLGLEPARYSDKRWLELLAEEPLLLRVPLVRSGQRLTVGLNEEEWKAWVRDASA